MTDAQRHERRAAAHAEQARLSALATEALTAEGNHTEAALAYQRCYGAAGNASRAATRALFAAASEEHPHDQQEQVSYALEAARHAINAEREAKDALDARKRGTV